MALTSVQKKAVFVVFLLLVLFSAGLEIFVVLHMLLTGEIETLKGVVAVLNGTGLAGFLLVFINLVRKQFLMIDMITETHLLGYFEGRLRSLSAVPSLENPVEHQKITNELIRECLRLAEVVLREWIGDYHFELSVFEDDQHPIIVAYYDSGGELEPRSMSKRDVNPNYYLEQGYEVVELLSNPGNQVHVLANTRDPEHQYSFVDDHQRRRIGSTMLYCFYNEGPRALVIACRQAGALKKDRRMETLVRALGTAMRAEYVHCTLASSSLS